MNLQKTRTLLREVFPGALNALLASAGLFLLSACSPSAGPGPQVPPGGSPGQGAVDESFKLDYAEKERGRPGGTLRVSIAADPLVLDNQVTYTGQWFARIVGDFLVYLDEDGRIGPYLATSWEVSPDGKTYTFHLRRDVTFSDGTKFDAEAVRANFARIKDPRTHGELSTALLQPYIDGKVIDDHTFQARLREPFGGFLNVLASSYFCMLSPKAIRENPKGLSEKPVATGPFVVESYTRNQGIVFTRRRDYNWAPPGIGHAGPAYLDRIEVSFVPEALVRYTSLVAGQYDLTLSSPPQNAPAIRADPSLVLKNFIMPGIPTRMPFFNTEKAPFNDVRVRKAFALAVDREGVARIMGFGEFRLKTDFLSSISRYYDPAYKDVLNYDVAGANGLLDEAGWTGRDAEGYRTKNGRRLSATVYLSQSTTALVAIQSDVKKVGFELKLRLYPATQLKALVMNNEYQATSGGLSYNGNTPDVLYIRYHSSQINTGRFIGQNDSRLSDAELDDLLARARASRDPAELKRLYSLAQKRLVELVPAVPLYEAQLSAAYKTYVKGVLFDTSNNNPFFTAAWLDQ
jgi:peptide/nickel transport system substrate-binding protein